MTDMTKSLPGNAQLRDVDWSPERSERVLGRIHERRRRFALSSVGLVSATLAVAVAVAIIWFAQGGPSKQSAVALDNSDPVAQEGIRLDDGTRAIELGNESRLRLVEELEDRVTFRVDEGKGWFEVTPSETRTVEVVARDIRVEVLGTQFVVEIQGEIVHVWVQRGKVRVTTKDGSQIILSEGEYEQFEEPKIPVDKSDSEDSEEKKKETEPTPKKVKETRPTRPDPRPLDPQPTPPPPAPAPEPTPTAEPAEKPKTKTTSVDQLWKAADAARLRGDNKAAISTLTKLLDNHPDDARAALAAFSLGRVIISTKGGSPQVAARAFAKARKLDPKGPLVEDALLREVEAWDEAGDQSRVRSRAEKYMRLFPKGRYRVQLEQMMAQ